jgi:peptide/nickel transport system substrate-binding protein
MRLRSRATLHGGVLAGLIAFAPLLAGCDSSTPSPQASGTASATASPSAGNDGGPTATPDASTPPPAAILDGSAYKPSAARDGGSIVIGAVGAANLFQPYFVDEASDRAVAAAAWSGLVTLGPDGRWMPALAETVPTTANGGVSVPGTDGDAMTVTWRLRDGLEWSDGEPLTCDDVRYTWKWATDPDNIGVDTAGFEDLEDVECPTPVDMIWHFHRVYEPYLTLIPTPLPRHALEAIPMADQAVGKGFRFADLAKLPVSGPYAFKRAVPGEPTTMVANAHYQNPLTGKPAHLQTLTWRWYATPDLLVKAFRAGQVDVALGLAETDYAPAGALAPRTEAATSLTYETLLLNWAGGAGATGVDATRGCSHSVLVSSRGPGCPLADSELRQAIAAAIDRTALVDGPLKRAATAVASAVPDELWFASGEGSVGSDPERARRLLDDAGWRPGPDGVRVKDGLAARIEICTLDEPWRVAMARTIVTQLADVGVAAEISPVGRDDLDADPAGGISPCSLAGGNFDAALVPVESSVDPSGVYFAFHSSQAPPNGTNVGAVSDRAIDEALDVVRESADPAALRAAIRAFERAARESAADVPLLRRTIADLVGMKVRNVTASPVQVAATWNIADWFRAR